MPCLLLVYPQKESEDSDVEALGNNEEEIEAECERIKRDPLAEFRNADDDEPIRKKSCNFTEELHCYESITGVNLT